jgi:hypothetical protein
VEAAAKKREAYGFLLTHSAASYYHWGSAPPPSAEPLEPSPSERRCFLTKPIRHAEVMQWKKTNGVVIQPSPP